MEAQQTHQPHSVAQRMVARAAGLLLLAVFAAILGLKFWLSPPQNAGFLAGFSALALFCVAPGLIAIARPSDKRLLATAVVIVVVGILIKSFGGLTFVLDAIPSSAVLWGLVLAYISAVPLLAWAILLGPPTGWRTEKGPGNS